MSKLENLHAELSFVSVHGANIQDICHGLARKSGWWTDVQSEALFTAAEIQKMVPEKLLLIHSEVSEACEAHRKNLMDDKLPDRHGLEVELADAAIRIFDLAGALGLDLGGAMAAKLSYNATRKDHTLAHRRAAGGKAY